MMSQGPITRMNYQHRHQSYGMMDIPDFYVHKSPQSNNYHSTPIMSAR